MKKYILGTGISLCLLMSSCLNDSFLEVYPKGQQTEATVFTTYDNFKTYAWGLYNVFFGYTYDTGQTDEIFRGDFESDNMIKGLSGYEGQWAYQKAKATDEVKEWDYDYIRRVNLMLDNIDGSQMNEYPVQPEICGDTYRCGRWQKHHWYICGAGTYFPFCLVRGYLAEVSWIV